MRLRFAVYYLSETLTGTIIDDWKAMPDEGVLGIVEVIDRCYGHPPKYAGVRHAYRDYYWMNPIGEIGSGSALQIPSDVDIKRGLYVDDETWMDVYNNRIMIDEPYVSAS